MHDAGNELSDASHESAADGELVVFSISGVQSFITESRRTADLFVSSRLMSELAYALAAEVPAGQLVLPAVAQPGNPDDAVGMPNRVVAVAPLDEGRALAKRMTAAVRAAWRVHDPQGEVAGFPSMQWVVIPPDKGGYAGQWDRAQTLLAQRKRIRDFTFTPVPQERVCTLTGRWPGSRDTAPGLRERGEFLSRIGWIKRGYNGVERFPSTSSIASAPYRAGIIDAAPGSPELHEAVSDLRTAVEMIQTADSAYAQRMGWRGGDLPGILRSGDEDLEWLRRVEGAWCEPGTWDAASLRRDHGLLDEPDSALCELGSDAARGLEGAARRAKTAAPARYLAVLAQDADQMGAALSRPAAGRALREWHGRVSLALRAAGGLQRAAIEGRECLGRVVYAGGDDVLALVPLAHAMTAARLSYEAFRTALAADLPSATVSTAVVFFHVSAPLQSAVEAAQNLLKRAKEHGRPGLGVTVLRRGGERATWISRWRTGSGGEARAHLDTLVKTLGQPGGDGALSARLAMGLERDSVELASLNGEWLRMELTRRAIRHGVSPEGAAALLEVAEAGKGSGPPVDAMLVAQFLAAEGEWK